MSLSLEGRRALVTGSARRLGRRLVLALAQAGADVVVHYRSGEDAARAVVDEARALGRDADLVQADFGRVGAATEMMAEVGRRHGSLDIVINNVGNYPIESPATTTESTWADVLQTNLVAAVGVSIGALELFPSSGGHIVNVGYVGVENVVAHPTATAYQASKTGLLVFTKSLAQAVGARGVRVNMISPGQLDNSVDLPDDIDGTIPLGRAGTSTDIVRALMYLLEPDGYVTGVNIDVAGGYRLSSAEKWRSDDVD